MRRSMVSLPIERFRSKIEHRDGCWIWTAGLTAGGYAKFRDGRTLAGHRWSYAHFVGAIPAGCDVHHLCAHRACVNPEHLLVLTKREHQNQPGHNGHVQRSKTHCKKGHPFAGGNLYVYPSGRVRACKTCRNESTMRWLNRNRDMVRAKSREWMRRKRALS